jgi:isoleucyl-tRNA synthetase
MLATLAGCLALALGVAVLLLPVLVSELSRPRDAAWGAVVLLLGLVLVTGAERLTGAPMLAVLCGGLLVGRLGVEVGQGRWRQLTPEEQQRLGSPERWRNGLAQLGASLAALSGVAVARLGALGGIFSGLGGSLGGLEGGLGRGRNRRSGKRWVRPEAPAMPSDPAEPAEGAEPAEEAEPTEGADPAEGAEASEVAVVSSFDEIDERLAAATNATEPAEPTESNEPGESGGGESDPDEAG